MHAGTHHVSRVDALDLFEQVEHLELADATVSVQVALHHCVVDVLLRVRWC